jgi:hypothetical protein
LLTNSTVGETLGGDLLRTRLGSLLLVFPRSVEPSQTAIPKRSLSQYADRHDHAAYVHDLILRMMLKPLILLRPACDQFNELGF